jgi:hypothetical protein
MIFIFMSDKKVVNHNLGCNTFKARIKASKSHWLEKVISHRETIKDSNLGHYKTYMTVFMPKLTHRNKIPSVMCHLSNGAGSCMFRLDSPNSLRKLFDKMAGIVDSDIWFDLFQELQSISDNLIDNGEVLLDKHFVDVGNFKQSVGIDKKETFPFLEVKP